MQLDVEVCSASIKRQKVPTFAIARYSGGATKRHKVPIFVIARYVGGSHQAKECVNFF